MPTKQQVHICTGCPYHLTGPDGNGQPWEDCIGKECPSGQLAPEWRRLKQEAHIDRK